MLPIGDEQNGRVLTPVVNTSLIAINVVVFLIEMLIANGPPGALDAFFATWGMIPAEVAQRHNLYTIVTSQFLHAGWLHLGGNMLFLWVFGDNVEDAMGHAAYLLFYLLVALIAGLAQVASGPNSTVPGVGASGAIAGVMAAYLVLYPGANVRVLIPIIIIPWITNLPAFVLMLFWFFTQVLSGAAQLGARATGGEGGVAWFAHIGGFVAGLVLVWFFRTRRRSLDVRHQYDRFGWGSERR
jgi:membrane associated rhomboid family serine protease